MYSREQSDVIDNDVEARSDPIHTSKIELLQKMLTAFSR